MTPTDRIHSLRGQDTIRFTNEHESWRISDKDHEFLLEEASNCAQYDFEIDVDQGDLDGDDEEEQHPDDVDVEIISDGSDSDDDDDGGKSDDAD